MLELRPNCECCDRDLPFDSPDARICTFEHAPSDRRLRGRRARRASAPMGGGGLTAGRSARRVWMTKYPASTARVLKPQGCAAGLDHQHREGLDHLFVGPALERDDQRRGLVQLDPSARRRTRPRAPPGSISDSSSVKRKANHICFWPSQPRACFVSAVVGGKGVGDPLLRSGQQYSTEVTPVSSASSRRGGGLQILAIVDPALRELPVVGARRRRRAARTRPGRPDGTARRRRWGGSGEVHHRRVASDEWRVKARAGVASASPRHSPLAADYLPSNT